MTDEQFKQLTGRFDALDDRLASVDKRLDKIEKRLDDHDYRFDKTDQRLDILTRDNNLFGGAATKSLGHMRGMERRLDATIDGVRDELKAQLSDSYDLVDHDLQRRETDEHERVGMGHLTSSTTEA